MTILLGVRSKWFSITVVVLALIALGLAWYRRDILSAVMPWRNQNIGKPVYQVGLPNDWPLTWLKLPPSALTYPIDSNPSSPAARWEEHYSFPQLGTKSTSYTISVSVTRTREYVISFIEKQLEERGYRQMGTSNASGQSVAAASSQYISPDRQATILVMTVYHGSILQCIINATMYTPALSNVLYEQAKPIAN
jgi:hypothetical protein